MHRNIFCLLHTEVLTQFITITLLTAPITVVALTPTITSSLAAAEKPRVSLKRFNL